LPFEVGEVGLDENQPSAPGDDSLDFAFSVELALLAFSDAAKLLELPADRDSDRVIHIFANPHVWKDGGL
jgi:hypothetical protein